MTSWITQLFDACFPVLAEEMRHNIIFDANLRSKLPQKLVDEIRNEILDEIIETKEEKNISFRDAALYVKKSCIYCGRKCVHCAKHKNK